MLSEAVSVIIDVAVVRLELMVELLGVLVIFRDFFNLSVACWCVDLTLGGCFFLLILILFDGIFSCVFEELFPDVYWTLYDSN